jgi:hypothetical protein
VYTRQVYTQPVRITVYTVYSVQCTILVILPSTTRGWSPLVNFVRKWRMENVSSKMEVKMKMKCLPQTTKFCCLEEELQYMRSGTGRCSADLLLICEYCNFGALVL